MTNPKSQIQNETRRLSYKNCSEVNSAGSKGIRKYCTASGRNQKQIPGFAALCFGGEE
jgi:hypothetical protein